MMTKEELLTLRDILHDFKHNGDVVTQDFVEAHIACIIEEVEERAELRATAEAMQRASHQEGA
jgi:hypothetical protein